MAEKTNGHDSNTVEMVAILREIRDELRGTNARIDGTNARVDTLTQRVDRMATELFDNMVELTSKIHQDHEKRLVKVETELAKLSPRGGGSRRPTARK